MTSSYIENVSDDSMSWKLWQLIIVVIPLKVGIDVNTQVSKG